VETVLMVAEIIVLLSLSALVVYIIIVLGQVRELLERFDSNLQQINARLIPTLDNMEVITAKLRVVLENFDEQMNMLKSSVETIKSVADNVSLFEKRVQEAVESPIMDVMNTIGGMIRGFSSFITRIVGGGPSSE
jgi:uncharacterized protein YoxC